MDAAPLTVGEGIFAYIEPESLIRVRSGFVVVGSPSYTWAPGTDADSLPLSADQHLAAAFTPDGRAALVDKPVRGEVGSVRAVALRGDRWGVMFDEVVPDTESGIHRTVSLWYGEHDGAGWALLERLDIPEDRELDFHSSSELVRVGEDLVWVVATRLPNLLTELVEYDRREGEWRHEVLSHDWVETAALAFGPEAGLWMAQFGGSPGVPKSIKVFRRRGPRWVLVQRFQGVAPGVTVPDLGISAIGRSVTVSWRASGPADRGAYALTGISDRVTGRLELVDASALQVMPLGALDGRPAWVVTHLDDSGGSAELRLLRSRPLFEAERVASAPSPYLAFLASLAFSASDVLVVGPEVSSDPADPFVRSLLLRLSSSCT